MTCIVRARNAAVPSSKVLRIRLRRDVNALTGGFATRLKAEILHFAQDDYVFVFERLCVWLRIVDFLKAGQKAQHLG